MARENPSLTHHTEQEFGGDLRTLQEVARNVAEVAMHPGWEAIVAILDAEADAINEAMQRRKPLKKAEYVYRHGRLGGLQAAVEAIPSILAVADRREKQAQEAADAAAQEATHG
jgi:hypothetical protein